MNDAETLKSVLNELADTSRPFSPTNLFCFSDLDRERVAVLQAVWPDLPERRRLALLEDLSELAEVNLEVNVEAVSRMGLEDQNPEVRAVAIESLWECESPDLLGIFFNLLTGDPEARVRAAAASALGRYVYMVEMDELDPRHARRLENALLTVATGNDHVEVRRRAIEALGYSSRPEVPAIIEAAYASPEESLKVSALLAMGRSGDRRWQPQVMNELTSVEPPLRFEAVRAAGELELRETAPALIESLDDADSQVRSSAIWSLGQVGGLRARQALEELLREADEDEAGHVQEALDNLNFEENLEELLMLDIEGNPY